MRAPKLRPLIAAAVAVAALAVPATASAEGELEALLEPLYHQQGGSYKYDGQTGTQLFTLLATRYDPAASSQAIVGTFGLAAFAGVLYEHHYDRENDVGHYVLKGTADPTGAAPPMPVLANLTATLDRNRSVIVFSLDGTIAGQPFSGSTGPIVNPFYSPLS